MAKLPNYFLFKEILNDLELACEEALKTQGLLNTAIEDSKRLNESGFSRNWATSDKLDQRAYLELGRLTFEMIFVTLTARVEQTFFRLHEELAVLDNWFKQGTTKVAASIARNIIEGNRVGRSIPKPVVLNKVKAQLKSLLKVSISETHLKYIVDSYKRRDKLMHGKNTVNQNKKNVRLRRGAISKLRASIYAITNVIYKSIVVK
jgi:hypothetical protein